MNEMHELQQLRCDLPERGAGELPGARDRLLAAIRQSQATEPAIRRWPALLGSRFGGMRIAVAGGLVAAAGVGLLVLPSQSTRPAPPPTPASYVLRRAALAAGAQPVPRPDQYVHTESLESQVEAGPDAPNEFAYNNRVHLDEWNSVNGSRQGLIHELTRSVEKVPGMRFPSRSELAAATEKPPGKDVTGWIKSFHHGSASLDDPTYAFLASLPTDPDRLLAYLSANRGNKDISKVDSGAVWGDLVDLNSWGSVPPRLRAAMFKVAEKIPGIKVDANAVDEAGRHGIGVWKAVANRFREELIFAPGDNHFLGGKDVILAPGTTGSVPVGTVDDSWALLRTTIEDRLPAHPPFSVLPCDTEDGMC